VFWTAEYRQVIVSEEAAVYLSAVLEYLASDNFETGRKYDRRLRKRSHCPEIRMYGH
jgi:hypothetical protein